MIANSVRIYTYDTVNYYGYDPHGNVVSIGGKTYTYDAFGNQTNDNTDDTNPFRYSGEYFDSETGFIYLRNRYYDSSIGRFITEDPVRDGLNWYVYCNNNPVGFVDPLGTSKKNDRYIYDWCQNYADIKEGSQAYINISSAVSAHRSGLISYENLAFNIVENGGQLREEKKLSPVTVAVNGYTINITVHVNYSGDLAFKNFGSTGYTYSQLASLGVSQYWSGDIGNYRINTSVSELNLNVYRAIETNISVGVSTNSNVDLLFKGRPVNIYFSDYEKVLNWSEIENKNVQRMKILGGHEIGGHAAFGLLDNYGENAVNGFESLMNGGFSATTPPYAIDLAYMLYNYKNSGFKHMIHYSENPALLDKYAPGWTNR